MKYMEEFRSKEHVKGLLKAIRTRSKREWIIMEMCGGQTHSIAQYRLEELLPPNIRLVHGPGCPVCVTPETILNRAIAIASVPGVIFTSFGDMLRVPGSKGSLLTAKSRGADVRIVYSPLDAVEIATANPDREVVFFGIGFETTAPLHALALKECIRRGLTNFSLLTSLVTVPPAIRELMSDPENTVQGVLGAGHVCAITGYTAYHDLARQFKLPVSITGFEPADLLWGIYNCVDQLENKDYSVRNAYPRIVSENGNRGALQLMEQFFEPVDQEWRGLGVISQSGLRLRKDYEPYNATLRFSFEEPVRSECSVCRAGDIMRGKIQPRDCPEFSKRCTPDHPLGAAMVSAEGMCSAFYKYADKL
ncbi:MAG: hydrogenase formation protein HypD [Bacteroidales bacterium]